jgi:predicted lactoylglutathione lyase
MLSFYDSVLSAVGAQRKMAINKKGVEVQLGPDISDDDLVAVAYGKYYPEFWVQLPENKKEATPGNGVHISFACKNSKQVDQVYKAALDAGGIDNGPPGPRPHYSDRYYGAFFIDPCGNKLEATFYDMGIYNYCTIS